MTEAILVIEYNIPCQKYNLIEAISSAAQVVEQTSINL